MNKSPRATAAAAGLLALAGCATDGAAPGIAPPSAAGDVISISVGPCFGFCPVYTTVISPGGTVVYTGERHTKVLGERRREAGAEAYRALSADLAAYRPADGTTQRIECNAAITDTSTYTITWRTSDGREAVATHQSRCASGPGHKLDEVLKSVPDRLGITAWAKQITRSGASRG